MAVPFVSVIHATPIARRIRNGAAGNAQCVRRVPDLRAHQRLPEKVVQGYRQPRQQGRSARRNRYPRSGPAARSRLAPISPPRRPISTWPASPRRAIRICSKSDSVSKQDVDNCQRRLRRQDKRWCSRREANVKRLEELESFKRVYAPFSGVITQRNVDIGNADQRRQWRHVHQGDVRPGANRSVARLRLRAAVLRSVDPRPG